MRLCKRNDICVGILITFLFFWNVCCYFSGWYRCEELWDTHTTDIMFNIVVYLFQVVGMLLTSAAIRRQKWVNHKSAFAVVVLLTLVANIWVLFEANAILFLLANFVFHILAGILQGVFFYYLCIYVSADRRFLVFGIAYALAPVGNMLVTILTGKWLLQSPAALLLSILSVLVVLAARYRMEDGIPDTEEQQSGKMDKRIAIAFFLILLICLTSAITSFFTIEEQEAANIRQEVVRGIYAIGLIGAAAINQKDRKIGAICCLISLSFPFASILMSGGYRASVIILFFFYIGLGFSTMYRITVFVDIATSAKNLLYVCTFGFVAGRLGEAFGTVIAMVTKHDAVILSATAALFFEAAVIFFILFYQSAYCSVKTEQIETEEERIELIRQRYNLTSRECDVMILLSKGLTNKEIGKELFVSENTVKFHVGNLLKKTQTQDRTKVGELLKVKQKK